MAIHVLCMQVECALLMDLLHCVLLLPCDPQSVIDGLYIKVEAEEQKRAQEKQQKPTPAPAGAAAGPALATA